MMRCSIVKEAVLAADLDLVGITSAAPFPEHEYRIWEMIKCGYIPDWNPERLSKFCDPRSVLPDAKSVISVAECYLTSEPADATTAGNPCGTVARYTWRNYYKDVYLKLKKVASFIRERTGAKCRYYSCGPLSEKPLAERAGIGWYGKHSIIMTDRYGSWIVLGELVTNIEIAPLDERLNMDCGSCVSCIKNCPTHAIVRPYVIDKRRCLQYLMNWRGILPLEIREVWGNRLYGCTTCQDHCPRNKKIRPPERKPALGYIGSSLPLIPLLATDEKDFRARFRGNQLGANWIHFDCIQRNAVIALGNLRDETAVPALVKTLKHPSEIVRAHAVWALGKFSVSEARRALEKIALTEKSDIVKREIKNAFRFMPPRSCLSTV